MKARIRQAALELLSIFAWALVIFIALWSVGAAFGVIQVGFCMVAGCR